MCQRSALARCDVATILSEQILEDCPFSGQNYPQFASNSKICTGSPLNKLTVKVGRNKRPVKDI